MDRDRRTLVAACAAALAGVAALGGPDVAVAQSSPGEANAGPPTPNPSRVGLLFRPNHVALRVAELNSAIAWWERVFGARLVRRSRIETIDPGIEIAFLHIADGFHIELVGGGHVRQAVPPPADIAADYGIAGWKHVGFTVQDMDEVVVHLKNAGVTIDYDVTRADYGVRIVLLREPNGYFIELYAPLA